MDIHNWVEFKLAGTYTRLRSLAIEGVISKQCLEAFSAPNLTSLDLYVDKARDYFSVVSCKGIDLRTLKNATIGWIYRIEDDTVAEFLVGIREFLMAAPNLEKLVLLNTGSAALVLKLLTDDCISLYQSHPLWIVLDDDEMELGRGDNRSPSVALFREETGCIPDCSWEDVFLHLAGALEF
ncbi:hypothetical protein M408DRAFT_22908 [Serendipita vermifera MAFF 305830]|uniref:Uncharacterized protein n=1 Tax=Serendipita vermifera MAFF 305830 TaxID=933852 RepID=A0A0C2WTV0_SERVB|nr:hypothetical protein M408DRAFT_22908 [Serendipita vermifera MAFF 305830]